MKQLNEYLLIVCSFIISFAFSSCKPDLQVSDVQYYTALNGIYLLNNSKLSCIQTQSDSWKDSTGNDWAFYSYASDYYIENSNTYEVGFYLPDVAGLEIDPVRNSFGYSGRVYLKINGVMKYFDTEPKSSISPKLISADDGIYVFFDETQPTGETDRLGNAMYNHIYKVSKDGGVPFEIATQAHSEIGGPIAIFNAIKKYENNFYFAGKKGQTPYFCESKDLRQPYILSMAIGEATDFCKIGNKFLICGQTDNLARFWTLEGNNLEEFDLPISKDATESCAGVIDLVGNDIYIGGRIGTKPAIWKNGEIYAIYEEFPPHQNPYYLDDRPDVRFYYHSGFVRALRVVGDKAYSIVETSNAPNSFGYIDNKLMAVEWDFSKDPVTCQYRYDLVEMLRDGSIYLYKSFYHDNLYTQWVPGLIEPYETYWDKLEYTHPRIALQYVKDK